MKKILITLLLSTTFSTFGYSQSTLIGAEPFSVTIPQGYNRTTGNNNLATVQWENANKGIYGYVFFEHKYELLANEVEFELESYANLSISVYSNLNDYNLIKTKKYKTSTGLETVQKEFKYFDVENEIKYHMFLNVFKTKEFIYVMMNYADDKSSKNGLKDIESIINNFKLP